MAIVTGITAEHMLELAGENIEAGFVDVNGHLLLTKRNGTQVDAGDVRAPNLADATTVVKGISRFSTTGEIENGTSVDTGVSPAGLSFLVRGSSLAAGVNLDDVTRVGHYHQGTQASATVALNYPLEGVGGELIVEPSFTGALFYVQRYHTRPSGGLSRVFQRSKHSTSAWSSWFELTARPKVQLYVDNVTRSFTAWTLGPTTTELNDLRPSSRVKMFYHVPSRNESGDWGGFYCEPQVRFRQAGVWGSWQSLGSTGHDLMVYNTMEILSFNNMLLIDPGITANAFDVQFRFYFKPYNGTMVINGSHDLNAVSGTATVMTGNNGLQHAFHTIVEEILP